MSQEKIFNEIKEELGQVPGFFQEMPVEALESEWNLFKRAVLSSETSIPPKYKELIGIAAAAAKQCWYCTNFHTGVAGLHGASEEEIREAVLLAKFGAGWSTYFNGANYNKDKFLKELQEVGEYISNK